MSVLIKGMGMPTTCSECQLAYDFMACGVTGNQWYDQDNIDASFDSNNARLPDCPLKEIPEKHGRLIDADRLMRVYEDRLEKVIDRYGVDSSERGILSGAIKLLMIELGIVEAEGDE